MRLLGGILRPSLNQVTCGWGKLRMRGAGITAPSPWETDWVRSPSSKLPITAGKQTKSTQVRVRKGKGCVKSQTQITFSFLKSDFWCPQSILPSAFCCEMLHRATLMDSAVLLPWFRQVHRGRLKEPRRNDSQRDTEGTLNWLIFIFRILLCGCIKGNQSWSRSKCVHYSTW